MTTITRREFLQISGILLAGWQWFPSFGVTAAKAGQPVQGRTLAPLTVTRADGSAGKLLLPDSVVPLLGVDGDRYLTSGGLLPRALVQPLTVTPKHGAAPALPFLAEVCAPAAAVRASCAADAPLLGRIGHAGTATIRSRLSDGRGGAAWYEVETGDISGWSPSSLWTPVDPFEISTRPRSVIIDRARQTLTVMDGDSIALQALVSVAPEAAARSAAVSGRQPSGPVSDGSGVQQGAPWLLRLDSGELLGGSTWHNRFGSSTPGMLAQMPPQVARWLYGALADGSTVAIR